MSEERPRFCPFCGEPIGSFFGHQGAHGECWCERCQEWFRAEHVDEADVVPAPGMDAEE